MSEHNGTPQGHRLIALVEVMDTLRRECPWDSEQTHESLAKYLIEEAYETVETIERGDYDTLAEELGDVLLQVVFHARVAAERGPDGFTIDDVADAIIDKLVRRHPHVFSTTKVAGADEVRANWEAIKPPSGRRKANRPTCPCWPGCRSGSPPRCSPTSCRSVPPATVCLKT